MTFFTTLQRIDRDMRDQGYGFVSMVNKGKYHELLYRSRRKGGNDIIKKVSDNGEVLS